MSDTPEQYTEVVNAEFTIKPQEAELVKIKANRIVREAESVLAELTASLDKMKWRCAAIESSLMEMKALLGREE